MPVDPYQKLENFTSVITADAVSESMEIYDEIKRESQSILTAAENRCLEEAFLYVKNEASRIRNEAGRTLSRRMMENKRKLYTRRTEMGRSVMETVSGRLREYAKTPEYRAQLRRMLERALDAFSGDTVIFLREEDMPLAPELFDGKRAFDVSFERGGFELGGLMASCPSRHLQIDETFDTAMNEIRDHFAELMGLQMDE